jgi:phosphatidylinositol alpha-1,6-mannosyltransferase
MSQEERYKGHDVVLRALPALLARVPGLCYDIVGDGDGRPELEALAYSLGVAGAVTFHGVVPEETLRSLYAAATAFVMPSRGEGFGLVYLEAMAHGTPVIAAQDGAAAEIILDGRTGFLIDPTSVEAVIESVLLLLADPDRRDQMGRTAAEHVEAKFTFPPYRDRLRALLAETGALVR